MTAWILLAAALLLILACGVFVAAEFSFADGAGRRCRRGPASGDLSRPPTPCEDLPDRVARGPGDLQP